MTATAAISTAEALKEMMEKFDASRAAWVARFGTDHGFNEWFTAQVNRGART